MTPDDLVERAHRAVDRGTYFGPGKCLASARTLAGAPGMANAIPAGGYATLAWQRAEHRYSGFGQAGTFEFWTGGTWHRLSNGKRVQYGHVAISLGLLGHTPWSISLDVRRRGRLDPIPTARIHDDWGLTHVGHTTDINGVNIAQPEKEWFEDMKAEDRAAVREVVDNAIAAAMPKIASNAAAAVKAELLEALQQPSELRTAFRQNVRVPVDAELTQRHLGKETP